MKITNRSGWVGVILIILGVLFLIENLALPFLHIPRIFFSWSFILVVIGVLVLINSRKSIIGFALLFVGGISMASKILDYSFRGFIYEYWPLMLIAVGAYLLYQKGSNGEADKEKNVNENNIYSDSVNSYIDEIAILSSVKRKYKINDFRGGKVTAILGGVELDFYDSNLADGEQRLEITSLFGGVDLYIPPDWRVIVKTASIFGGTDDKRRRDGAVLQENKVLVIEGVALFGGVDIKN